MKQNSSVAKVSWKKQSRPDSRNGSRISKALNVAAPERFVSLSVAHTRPRVPDPESSHSKLVLVFSRRYKNPEFISSFFFFSVPSFLITSVIARRKDSRMAIMMSSACNTSQTSGKKYGNGYILVTTCFIGISVRADSSTGDTSLQRVIVRTLLSNLHHSRFLSRAFIVIARCLNSKRIICLSFSRSCLSARMAEVS